MFNNMLDESTEGREGEREGREKESIETDKIFEQITVENFPNMGKEIVTQVQEA